MRLSYFLKTVNNIQKERKKTTQQHLSQHTSCSFIKHNARAHHKAQHNCNALCLLNCTFKIFCFLFFFFFFFFYYYYIIFLYFIISNIPIEAILCSLFFYKQSLYTYTSNEKQKFEVIQRICIFFSNGIGIIFFMFLENVILFILFSSRGTMPPF